MAESHYQSGTMDVSQQKKTFNGIMTFSARWAIPGCAAAAAFVASMLDGAGLASVFSAVIGFFIIRWVLSIFSH